ncbi:platelet-activating factor acetylhydrolase [Microdochium nivale]|nr:platelet-activating factor acetylhydrolase [Microdochium nivale]
MSREPAYTMLPVREPYSDNPDSTAVDYNEDDVLPLGSLQQQQQQPHIIVQPSRRARPRLFSWTTLRHRRLPSWRRLALLAIVLYIAYCFVTWQPLFAHNLPEYTGLYKVGAIDVEVPVSNPRVITPAKLKNSGGDNDGGTDRDAFQLDTVLFTLYYPADEGVASDQPLHRWIPSPVSLTARGYARAAGISNWFTNGLFTAALVGLAGSLTIPAQVDVPLVGAPPGASMVEETRESAPTFTKPVHPVVVFTHGMASSRTDYTHYCGELASRGYVVAAIEHRDGSSPGSLVMLRGKEDPNREVVLFKLDDVYLPDTDEQMDLEAFKKAQLAFRQAEIEAVVETLREVNAGKGDLVQAANSRLEGEHLKQWAGKLNTDDMVLAGHSYGATGVLQALKPVGSTLSNRNGTTRNPKLPFAGAIALDPGKSSGQLNADLATPLLVVHSNSWSASTSIFYGRPHFSVVKAIVSSNNADRGNPSWFMTSLGTSHPSVTDAPLIEPLLLSWTTGARIDVYEGLRQYVHVSEDFMWFLLGSAQENGGGESGSRGEKRGLLKEKAEYPEYDESAGFGKYHGQGEGWRKYWQVHVAPPFVDEDGNA